MITLGPGAALACGTLEPVQQRSIDREVHEAMREAVIHKIQASDLIFVGRVISLKREEGKSDAPGEVTLEVTETLKGSIQDTLIRLPWRGAFVLSCKPMDMFDNVGFAERSSAMVYVADGRITRTLVTTHVGYAGSLSFAQERGMVLANSGN